MAKTRAELPKSVLSFLNSAKLVLDVSEILSKYNVPEEKFGEIAVVFEGAIFDSKKIGDIPAGISKITKLDPTESTELARELVGHWLLPIEQYVGDVSGFILKWGGSVKNYSSDRIARRLVQADQFTREAMDNVGIKIEDAVLHKRLEYVLETYVRGVRTEDETLMVLTRSRKVGGVQMNTVQANQLINYFKKKLGEVEIDRGQDKQVEPAAPKTPPKRQDMATPPQIKKEEVVNDDEMDLEKIKAMVSANTKPKLALEPTPKVQPKFEAETVTEDEEIEAKQFAEITKKMPESPVSIPTAVKSVVSQVKLDLTQPEQKKRFETIVSSRMRGIRDAMETRSTLESPAEQGGFGLKGLELVAVVEVIEKVFNELRQKLNDIQVTGKAEMIAKNRDVVAKRQQNTQETETDEIDAKYEKLTGKMTTRTPGPAKTALSPGSLVQVGSTKPSMRDVTAAKRLIGPVDELGNMDVTSFRRLSKDASEAIIKIKDKIDLLEKDSYAKRLEGIKAWKGSPINQLYLSIMRSVLVSGKSVVEVITERTEAEEEVLSAEEVKVILKLNNQLRF